MVNKNKQNGEAKGKELRDDKAEARIEDTTDDEGGADTPPPHTANKEDKNTSKQEDKPVTNDNNEDEENIDDGTFEVEQIVDMECKKRWKCPVKFRVRWVGYSEKDDTWLPASELNCEDLINEFLEISGRTVEYKTAMTSKRPAPASFGGEGAEMTMQTRKAARYCYSELDEDADEVIPAGTRTRKVKSKPEPKPYRAPIPKKKHPARGRPALQEPQEYEEVEAVVDHRVRGRFTEYKVRWKGFGPKDDSWLGEAQLNCDNLLNKYFKQAGSSEEQAYEVQEIKEMRKGKEGIEYKVRWKGWSAKYDSWLPKEELNCPDLLNRFHARYPREEDEDEQLHEDEEVEEYEVEKILDERKKQGRIQYLVQWKGKGPKHNTWEPEEGLENAKGALKKYQNSVKSKKGKVTPKSKKPAKKKVDMNHESSPEVETPPPSHSKVKKPAKKSIDASPDEIETPSRSRRTGKNRSYSEFYDQ